jgi:hypothetical protein
MTKLYARPFYSFLWVVFLCIGLTPGNGTCRAQDAESEEGQAMNRLLDELATQFEFELLDVQPSSNTDDRKSLPSLRWTNDVRDSHSQGLVKIAVQDGLPLASVATYVWDSRVMHEFDILSRKAVRGVAHGEVMWQPSKGNRERRSCVSPAADEVDCQRI